MPTTGVKNVRTLRLSEPEGARLGEPCDKGRSAADEHHPEREN